MSKQILKLLETEAKKLAQAGLLRRELALHSPPGPSLAVGPRELASLVSGDYLGLATHASVKNVAKAAIDSYGVGLASPRSVSGTLTLHLELEAALTRFLSTEDAVVYASGYHAATGLFESLVSEHDYIFCDEQLHAAMADGLRLSRARVYSYRNNDMDHLEDRLRRSRSARFRLIVTDGVFPLDGVLADLRAICSLAATYQATVVVYDAQGIGVLGEGGRGTAEHLGVMGQVDIVVGSFAFALGGGAGGFVCGRRGVVDWLRQKSRPYLVSAALGPPAAAAAKKAVELVHAEPQARAQLHENIAFLRSELSARGLTVLGGTHAMMAVLVGDAVATQRMADLLYKKGVFALGFCHPVVPEGAARIRLQVTARHSQKALRSSVTAFEEVARELHLIKS